MLISGGLEKPVALKIVREDLAADPHFVEMFVDEARMVMSMSHANVVQAFDVGRIDDRWFIAMEFVEGTTLGALSRLHRRVRGAPIPPELVVTAVVEALRGLDYAHRRRDDAGNLLGVVHRDISPGNILVSREGEVKLTDFGIAKSEERSARSVAGAIKGKILYMAPEQLRGASVDLRADVYAMGVVLHELLAGRRPYAGDDTMALIPDILAGRRKRFGELAPHAGEPLAGVVERALAVEPGGRYPSAAAMRQALEQVARASGWILASTDLADLLVELEEEASAAPDGDMPSPPQDRRSVPARETGSITSASEATTTPSSDRFADLLGREIRRVASDEPVSVFVTRDSMPVVRPSDIQTLVKAPEPGGREVSSVITLPRDRAPRLAMAALVLFGAIGLTWIALREAQLGSTIAPHARENERNDEIRSPAETTTTTIPHVEVRPEPPVAAPTREATPAPTTPRTTPAASPRTRAANESGSRHATEAAPETASLWVASEPWGFVYVDGERVGRTALLSHPVAPGTHEYPGREPRGRPRTAPLGGARAGRDEAPLDRSARRHTLSESTSVTRTLVRDGRPVARTMRELVLDVRAPDGTRTTERLGRSTVRVGSRPGCDVVLADPTVSRLHFEIIADAQGFRLRDFSEARTAPSSTAI